MKVILGTPREQIIKEKAPTMMRRVAREAWGNINSVEKVRNADFPVWWVSTEGHGGYVAIVDAAQARPFEAHWTPCATYNILGKTFAHAYVFEEDCAWAVLECYEPSVRQWGYANSTKKDSESYSAYSEYVLGTANRWHPEALAQE